MEQDRVVFQLSNASKVTGETILKALWSIIQYAHEKHEYNKNNQNFIGETNYNQFMATNTNKDMLILENKDIHIGKLKEYLNEKGIGFTTKAGAEKGTTTLLFDVKNKILVEGTVDKVIKELTSNPQKAVEKLGKKFPTRTVAEKIAYFKEHVKYGGIGTPLKGKGKKKGSVK